MHEVYIVLSMAVIAIVAVRVLFLKDSRKRSNLELQLQGYLFLPLFPNIPLILYNFKDLNRLALAIALMLFLAPFLTYPFSPAYQDAQEKNEVRSKKRTKIT